MQNKIKIFSWWKRKTTYAKNTEIGQTCLLIRNLKKEFDGLDEILNCMRMKGLKYEILLIPTKHQKIKENKEK